MPGAHPQPSTAVAPVTTNDGIRPSQTLVVLTVLIAVDVILRIVEIAQL